MDTDNRVVRVGVWGLGAGRRGTKRRAMGNMYNNINNKKKKNNSMCQPDTRSKVRRKL